MRTIDELRADYAEHCRVHGDPSTRDRRYLSDDAMELLEAAWRVVEAAWPYVLANGDVTREHGALLEALGALDKPAGEGKTRPSDEGEKAPTTGGGVPRYDPGGQEYPTADRPASKRNPSWTF